MKIENLKINEIKPYEKNPRKNDQAVDIVAKSIKEFGFRVPIILDKNNVIIAGHTRLKAAEKLAKKAGYKDFKIDEDEMMGLINLKTYELFEDDVN